MAVQAQTNFALQGRVIDAVNSESAVEEMIDFIEMSRYQDRIFVSQELAGQAKWVAKHPIGHRLLRRIVAYLFHEDIDSMNLIRELVDDAEELCQDRFGSSVIREILGLCENVPDSEQRTAIAQLKQRAAIAIRTDRAKRLSGG